MSESFFRVIETRACVVCKQSFPAHCATHKYCDSCRSVRKTCLRKNVRTAYGVLSYAIKTKRLTPARELTCAQCGKPACHYDHRDYLRPLDVVAMCRSCNLKAGPGANPGEFPTSTTSQEAAA